MRSATTWWRWCWATRWASCRWRDDPVAAGLVLWYALAWVAVYLSLLHDHEPGESPVYTAVRDAATDPDGGLRTAAGADPADDDGSAPGGLENEPTLN